MENITKAARWATKADLFRHDGRQPAIVHEHTIYLRFLLVNALSCYLYSHLAYLYAGSFRFAFTDHV